MNIYAIDLNLLKVFEALLQERNVTRAGDKIGLAQSSMSNALNRLRHLFKDELFVRTPKSMRPTERALELAPQVDAALAQIRTMLGTAIPFEPASARGIVRIATSDNLKILLTPPLVAHLARSAPGVSLRMRPLDKDRLFDDLDSGSVDLAIGTFGETPRRIERTDLFEDSFVCLARKNHPKLKRGMSVRQFAALPHALVTLRDDASGFIDDVLAKKGLTRHVGVTVDQFSVLPRLVASSDYIAMCPRSISKQLATAASCAVYAPPFPLPNWRVTMLRTKRTISEPLIDWVGAEIQKLIPATLRASPG
ncbi:MAG: LysR family transcriptional regulator [Pseudomonadota bacterium]